MSDFGVTLYSEPDFKGKSCFVRPDGETYSLAATGLDKIASVKVKQGGDEDALAPGTVISVRLYLKKPEAAVDDGGDEGTGFTDFSKDAADTGKWASAGWLQPLSYAPNDEFFVFDDGMEDAGREIHETLPS